eukprot:gene5266-5319_t
MGDARAMADDRGACMRVVVIGTSGAGKTTLAQRIADRYGIPLVELDALNWRPEWVALSLSDPARFRREVDAATALGDWVVAGNYTSSVRDIVWGRATHLVWLDYSRSVVMRRVLWRSFWRAVRREVIWGGNREGFRLWLDPGHPVQWAWRTWQSNREGTARRLAEAASAHLRVVQVLRPRDAGKVFARLEGEVTRVVLESEQLAAIVASLSRARMSTYASLAGDDPAAALRLYERNMRMSEAFYTPLQCLEVCLRNKLHDRLSEVYGDRWFEDPRIGFAPGVLKSIALAAGTVCKAGKALTPGAIVAELSFGFWVGILATTYDETLWRRSLARAFRPDGRGLKRQVVHGRMNMLRRFIRN